MGALKLTYTDENYSTLKVAFRKSDGHEKKGANLGYFGARYYSSGLSIWLSVDPLSDMYPSTSPFMYVLGKPTALIDPNGMNAWIPPTEQGGAWTAEAGDSPGSLARDAGISQSEAEGIMRNYNASNGNNRSSDIMVYKGDQVTVPESGDGNTTSSENESVATATPYYQRPYPASGACESVSVVGVLGDLALDAVQYGLEELGMSERAARNTTNVASLGLIFITKKPRIRGTNLKNPSPLNRSLSYDRPNNYIPGPLYPNRGGGGDNWIWWAAGAGLAGGTAYFRIKHQQSKLNSTPLIQPLPQDKTRVQPIIRPYYGQ